MTAWHRSKVLIEDSVTVSHDLLHVVFGLLVWLFFACALRISFTSRTAWLWVFAVTLWNETADLWTEQWPDGAEYWPNRQTQYVEGVKDILLTMLVPTFIVAVARFRPQLFQHTRGTRRRR